MATKVIPAHYVKGPDGCDHLVPERIVRIPDHPIFQHAKRLWPKGHHTPGKAAHHGDALPIPPKPPEIVCPDNPAAREAMRRGGEAYGPPAPANGIGGVPGSGVPVPGGGSGNSFGHAIAQGGPLISGAPDAWAAGIVGLGIIGTGGLPPQPQPPRAPIVASAPTQKPPIVDVTNPDKPVVNTRGKDMNPNGPGDTSPPPNVQIPPTKPNTPDIPVVDTGKPVVDTGTSVPEPTSLVLLGLGAAATAALRRRRTPMERVAEQRAATTVNGKSM